MPQALTNLVKNGYALTTPVFGREKGAPPDSDPHDVPFFQNHCSRLLCSLRHRKPLLSRRGASWTLLCCGTSQIPPILTTLYPFTLSIVSSTPSAPFHHVRDRKSVV